MTPFEQIGLAASKPTPGKLAICLMLNLSNCYLVLIPEPNVPADKITSFLDETLCYVPFLQYSTPITLLPSKTSENMITFKFNFVEHHT